MATGNGLLVLTNSRGGRDIIPEIRNAVADVMGWSVNRPIRIPEMAITSEQLDGLAGWYRVDSDFPYALRRQMTRRFFDKRIRIQVADSGLTLNVDGTDDPIRLVPMTPNRFWIEGFGMRIGIVELEFHRNSQGVAEAASLHLSNAISRYVRE